MAKMKFKEKKGKKKTRVEGTLSRAPKISLNPKILLEQAADSLKLGDVDAAMPLARQALNHVEPGSLEMLAALSLCGEIYIELGDIESARQYFLQAVSIDEDGLISDEDGGGVEKFFWLAQLSEQGGHDSVQWYEKGILILRRQIQNILEHESITKGEENSAIAITCAEKMRKLAGALCSMVEVYMTDLSWEEDAESKCEALIIEATMVAPTFAEPWQTLANIRISQQRLDEATAALKRSLDIWKHLPSQDPNVPEYSTRVSLARLLMEADMNTDAIDVLERLVAEDDSSVEVWYLGGWGLYIMGEKQRDVEMNIKEDKSALESSKNIWISSRQWLTQALNLFKLQDYEDERLGEHTRELLDKLNLELGDTGDAAEDDDVFWSDVEESEDEAMVDV